MGLLDNKLIIRASAALEDAGAYDASPNEMACDAADQVDFWISYDEDAGATNGQVTVKVESAIRIGGTDYWNNENVVIETGALSQGSNVASTTQAEEIEFDPTAATAEFIHLRALNVNADKIRINVKESGDTSNPGTVVIYARSKAILSN